MKTRVALLQIALLTFLSAGALEAAPGDIWSVTLFRSMCYGSCPNYEITIFSSGRVRFKGLNWVETKGVIESRVEPSLLQPLFEKISEIKFWTYCDRDTQKVTQNGDVILTEIALDAPTFWIRAIGTGGSKKIEFLNQEPLKQLGSLIDSISGDSKWIGTPNHA